MVYASNVTAVEQFWEQDTRCDTFPVEYVRRETIFESSCPFELVVLESVSYDLWIRSGSAQIQTDAKVVPRVRNIPLFPSTMEGRRLKL